MLAKTRNPILIRVGVTGHRILTDLDKLDAGVEQAFHRIEQAFPGKPLSVISALAEGADRIVAHHVLTRLDSRLIVVLPLAKTDYLSDFKSEASLTEFSSLLGKAAEVIEMAPAASRDYAYESAGLHVLNNSDVLITIWDGRHAHGRGGTGEIVAIARERRLPIAWVHAGNRDPGTQQPTSLGSEQGLVTFENL